MEGKGIWASLHHRLTPWQTVFLYYDIICVPSIAAHCKLYCPLLRGPDHGTRAQWRSQKFFTGVRNSNRLHSPIFNRRPSLFLSRAELLTAERVITCRTPQWKLDKSCGDASWRTYNGCGTLPMAARTPSTFSLEEELSKFVGVDVS